MSYSTEKTEQIRALIREWLKLETAGISEIFSSSFKTEVGEFKLYLLTEEVLDEAAEAKEYYDPYIIALVSSIRRSHVLFYLTEDRDDYLVDDPYEVALFLDTMTRFCPEEDSENNSEKEDTYRRLEDEDSGKTLIEKILSEMTFTHYAGFLPADKVKLKKLQNAAREIAEGIRPEEILAIQDETIRNNGKKGIVITKDFVYTNYKLSNDIKKTRFRLEDLTDVHIDEKNDNYLYYTFKMNGTTCSAQAFRYKLDDNLETFFFKGLKYSRKKTSHRIAEEKARREAEEEARRIIEEEARRAAVEEEARRVAAEEKARRAVREEAARKVATEKVSIKSSEAEGQNEAGNLLLKAQELVRRAIADEAACQKEKERADQAAEKANQELTQAKQRLEETEDLYRKAQEEEETAELEAQEAEKEAEEAKRKAEEARKKAEDARKRAEELRTIRETASRQQEAVRQGAAAVLAATEKAVSNLKEAVNRRAKAEESARSLEEALHIITETEKTEVAQTIVPEVSGVNQEVPEKTEKELIHSDVAGVTEPDLTEIVPGTAEEKGQDIIHEQKWFERSPVHSKPHLNVGTIGTIGVGKTTLTAAITTVLNDKYGLSKPLGVDEIDKREEEKEKGHTVCVSAIEYESLATHFAHFDCPGNRDYLNRFFAGASLFDTAILVFNDDHTHDKIIFEQLLLARQAGVSHIIGFLNITDANNIDKEVLEMREMDVRSLAEERGFDEDIPIIRGSAKMALDDPESEWGDSIIELIEEIESYSQDLEPGPSNGAFFMPVQCIQYVFGRGVAAIGRIERGTVRIGDTVEISGGSEECTTATVMDIQIFGQKTEMAKPGDYVGLLLRGISREDIYRGKVLTTPGLIICHKRFEASVYLLKKNENGRHHPIIQGYQAHFLFRTMGVQGTILLPEGFDMLMPGDNAIIDIELDRPAPVEIGLRFAIREGGLTVGVGVVTPGYPDN